jgi:O-antigen/teichoic acid export membrane protein
VGRNVVLNLAGYVLPMLCAIYAIPRVIDGIGTDRYGILTLVWMLVGYFGLFDFGLGRAVTRSVAEALGKGEDQKVPTIVWTGLSMMLALGLTGAAVLGLLGPWLVTRVLNVPPAIEAETIAALRVVTFLIPIVTTQTALQGLLEAKQLFKWTNAVRVPLFMLMYLGPLFVVPFSSSLVPIVGVLAASRLVAWIALALLGLKAHPSLARQRTFQRSALVPLLRFGGWMTVTNLVSPIMVYMDRFFIAAMASVEVVAYYTTPYEVISKFTTIPNAVVTVMFPLFAATYAVDRLRTAALIGRGLRYVGLLIFPVTFLTLTFAQEGLSLWLGPVFAEQSTTIAKLLTFGIFVNSMTFVPYSALQGLGRADLTARTHAVELPLYLATLVVLVRAYGAEGAAIAWVGRVTFDALVLSLLTAKVLPEGTGVLRRAGSVVLLAAAALAGAALIEPLELRIGYTLVVAAAHAFVAFKYLIDDELRRPIRRVLRLEPRATR